MDSSYWEDFPGDIWDRYTSKYTQCGCIEGEFLGPGQGQPPWA